MNFTELNRLIKVITVLAIYSTKHKFNYNSLNKINIYNKDKVFGSPCSFLKLSLRYKKYIHSIKYKSLPIVKSIHFYLNNQSF